MRYAGWIVGAATTGIVVAASCIPDFQFKERKEPGGVGGQGTAGGGAGSAGGAGGSVEDAGVADGATVPCTDDASADECAPGEICCFHTGLYECDKCSATNQCNGGPSCADAGTYAKFYCNSPDDCSQGEHCCMTYEGYIDGAGMFQIVPQGILCQPSCTNTQITVCDVDADCPSGTCEPDNYPGYSFCPPVDLP